MPINLLPFTILSQRTSHYKMSAQRKKPTQSQLVHVWNKCAVIRGKNPDHYRKDTLGNVIYAASYGKTTKMGWHVDHIKPLAKGGSNSTRNLQALQSKANLSKSAKY